MPQTRRQSQKNRHHETPSFILFEYPDWMQQAFCGEGTYSPDLWTEPPKGDPKGRWAEPAQKLCMTQCPVQRDCLQYARSENIRDGGVWGGEIRSRKNGMTVHPPASTAWNRNGTPRWSTA